MKAFDYEGLFWRADEPTRQLGGRLRYEPAEGATLSIVGMLVESASSSRESFRINGFCGGAYVTLEDCRISVQISDGIDRSEYKVRVAFRGVSFEADRELEFDELDIRFDHLTHWTNRRSFSIVIKNDSPSDLSNPHEINISYLPQSREEFGTEDFTVALAFEHGISGDQVTEMRLSQQAEFQLRYTRPRRLDDVLLDARSLQSLITLSTDAPAVPTKMAVKCADIVVSSPGQESVQIEIPIELSAGNIAEHVALVSARTASSMFFLLSDIGGLEAVAKWMGAARDYHVAIGSLLTLRYSASLYEENRFLNALSAAESYHRVKFPDSLIQPSEEYKPYKKHIVKIVRRRAGRSAADWLNGKLQHSNEARLSTRLDEMVAYAGPVFAEIVGDAKVWAAVATLARNRMTHHDEAEPFERLNGDLNILAESVYILVMLCLLRDCGLGDDRIVGVQRPLRIRRLNEQVIAVVERLQKFIRENARKRPS